MLQGILGKSMINLTLGWHALNIFRHFLSQDTREQASFQGYLMDN